MKTTVVRYRTRPERAEENAALIAEVFRALERRQPPGLRYQAMRGSDGVSFTHVASLSAGAAQGEHPLTSLPEFKAFAAGVRERCEEPPQALESTLIGRYEGQPAEGDAW